MSSLRGKFYDRANIIGSGFSTLEKAVIKATVHDLKPPKEKHVRTLILYTTEKQHKITTMINLLAIRLESSSWMVVMKTLNTFHRLLRDGHNTFLDELKHQSKIFNQLKVFSDNSTPEAHFQSVFIRKYAQYLEEKVLVFKLLKTEFEKKPDITKTYTVEEAFEKLPRLQSQLNALINCKSVKDHINNAIINNCFMLLTKDSFKIYQALNNGIILLLESYFSMTKDNAIKALNIYKLFAKETDGIIQLYDIAKKFISSDLPELQHAPITLVDALENYIEDLEQGKKPVVDHSSKVKNLKSAKFEEVVFKEVDDNDFNKNAKDLFSDNFEDNDPFKHNKKETNSNAKKPEELFDPFENNADNLPTLNKTNSNDPFSSSNNNDFFGTSKTNSKNTTNNLSTSKNNDPFATHDPFSSSNGNNNNNKSHDPFSNDPFGTSSPNSSDSYQDKKK